MKAGQITQNVNHSPLNSSDIIYSAYLSTGIHSEPRRNVNSELLSSSVVHICIHDDRFSGYVGTAE